MAAINQKVLDDHWQDYPWVIEYDPDKCALCGSCVATCTFGAIKFDTVVIREVKSTNPIQPEPQVEFKVRPVVKQVHNLANMCRGCGFCERVCPNKAIRPVKNPRNRFNFVRAQSGKPFKRGGRNNLHPEVRTLDTIKIGRISQMTDPSLDSERHTFDLRAPFGRILAPDEVEFDENGRLKSGVKLPPVRWIYPILIADMSIGALSPRAWEALIMAVAYLNEEYGIPIRMSSGEGGVPTKLLRSKYIKYLFLQIASGHFGWNRIIQNMPYMQEDPAGVIIKIGQGAKPGDGGLLLAEKVAKHIQEIRGVPKSDLLSPPTHQGLYSIEESVQKMFLSFNAAFGFRVPVAIKVAASSTSVYVYNNLLRDPYHIVGGFLLDGIDGGTGAANEVSLDHSGHPIASKLRDCYLAAVNQGKQGRIPLWAGGGIGATGNLAADTVKMIALGANGVFAGKIFLQLMGCVGSEDGRCNACNTGLCPTGITTQDPLLIKRLDVDKAAERIVNYILATDAEIKKLLAQIGNSSLPVGRSDALVCTDKAIADRLQIQYAS